MLDPLTPGMSAVQDEFQRALLENADLLYPYDPLTPVGGQPFQGNVWTADVRGRAYAHAIATLPELAQADVRFLTVMPGDPVPGEGSLIPFDGGMLRLHFWAQLDSLSGESIAACSWTEGQP